MGKPVKVVNYITGEEKSLYNQNMEEIELFQSFPKEVEEQIDIVLDKEDID